MSIASSMQQIVMSGPGGPEVMQLAEAPVPTPGAGEILVRVQAAGINRPDILQRMGKYPVPPSASPIMGLEIAGIVESVGPEVTAFAPGDAVCALANGGGYATYCVVPAGQALPIPAGFSPVQAAALPETFFTVWANLFMLGELKDGQTALIHGGSSGIGTVAIQLAREFGARAIATVGGDDKAQACQKLGAETINYRTQDFVAEAQRLTQHHGVDVVLDMIAGPYLSRNVHALGMDGRLVVIATQGGVKDPELDIRLVMMKRARITGSMLRPRSGAEKAAIAASLREHVWPLLASGRVAPIIHATFPLAQVGDAHRMMEDGAHIGKIVLTMG